MITWRAAMESTGTSSEIKEQYKKNMKGLLGEFCLFPPFPKEEREW